MTIAELERAISSRQRVEKLRAQEKASFDYILADLIGRSVSRIYSSSAKLPAIEDVYPSLFNSEDIEQKKQIRKDELSALRFKQFANNFNAKIKGGETIK